MVNSFVKSGATSTGLARRASRSRWNASVQAGVQAHTCFLQVRSCRGRAMDPKSCTKRR